MLFMQRKAMIEGEPCVLYFDIACRRYSAESAQQLSSTVRFGAGDKVKGPPWRPERTIREPTTWKNGVVFYPDGTIAAGAVYLTNARGEYTYALTSDASEASHIRRYFYDGLYALWRPV